MIYGNLKEQKIVKELIEKNKSPILIIGPEGVGKFSFVLEFIKDKDYEKIIFNSPERSFKIDSARFLVSLSQRKSKKRIIVINDVHKFSYPSPQIIQGPLLKTLEETPSETIFILITHKQHKILPTIRSRSIQVKFGLVSKEETLKFLKENNFNDEEINYALNFYPHQPGKALKLLTEKKKLEIFRQFIINQDFDLENLKNYFNLNEFLENYILFKRNELLKKINKPLTKEIYHLKEALDLYYNSDYNLNFELQLANLILNN
ncbi:MAG: hypothetical protein KatS3mg096_158 [Candidatus Parcubacteria bacterium]|nr:MAG: hypothetical protein KatS3mg096_158 [Candidatus Parcubacteria bacterium]